MIEKECRYDGVYHKASLRANLDVIIRLISGRDILDENKNLTVEMGIPWIPLNPPDRITIINVLLYIAELDAEFLFSTSHWRVKILLAQVKEFTEFSEYKLLIADQQISVRSAVANNKFVLKYREFQTLFVDRESFCIRYDALSTVYQNCLKDNLPDIPKLLEWLENMQTWLNLTMKKSTSEYSLMKHYFSSINYPKSIIEKLFF